MPKLVAGGGTSELWTGVKRDPGPLPLAGAAHKAAGAKVAARQNPKNLPVTLIRAKIVVNAGAGCNSSPAA